MTEDETWVDVGHVDDFNTTLLKRVTAMNRDLAVSLKDGKFGAVSNACNHVGGPLGDGRLDRRLHRLPLAQLEISPL
jgi:nitrite reductase/ring-hydroxylating ferredoxin subunit